MNEAERVHLLEKVLTPLFTEMFKKFDFVYSLNISVSSDYLWVGLLNGSVFFRNFHLILNNIKNDELFISDAKDRIDSHFDEMNPIFKTKWETYLIEHGMKESQYSSFLESLCCLVAKNHESFIKIKSLSIGKKEGPMNRIKEYNKTRNIIIVD